MQPQHCRITAAAAAAAAAAALLLFLVRPLGCPGDGAKVLCATAMRLHPKTTVSSSRSSTRTRSSSSSSSSTKGLII